MRDNLGNKFIFNNHILACSEFDPELFQTGASLYEVIRLINKTPLFLKEHLKRFEITAKLKNTQLWLSEKEIASQIISLIESNEIINGNIKVVFTFMSNATQKRKCFLAYFVKHKYPTENEYKIGVETLSLNAERPTPNAKVAFKELREQANQIIEKKKIYEVILIDKNGFITEGSRSNIFFVKDNEVLTPPSESVLPGITREKVKQICNEQNIKLVEAPILFNNIFQFDAAFLTGTSPMVLPIKKIDKHTFKFTNGIICKIFEAYKQFCNKDLQNSSVH